MEEGAGVGSVRLPSREDAAVPLSRDASREGEFLAVGGTPRAPPGPPAPPAPSVAVEREVDGTRAGSGGDGGGGGPDEAGAEGAHPAPPVGAAEQQEATSARAVYWAAHDGRHEDLQLLLERGAPHSGHCDHDRWNALAWAADNGRSRCVELLLAAGADPSWRLRTLNQTALHLASKGGHVRCVAALLNAGVEVNTADVHGWTPLHVASHRGHLNVVRALLEAGAYVDALTTTGVSPVMLATIPNNRYCVLALLEHGANPNLVRMRDGRGPLHVATSRGYTTIARAMCERGADVELPSRDTGETPVSLAKKFWREELMLIYEGFKLQPLPDDVSRRSRPRGGSAGDETDAAGDRSVEGNERRAVVRHVLRSGVRCRVTVSKSKSKRAAEGSAGAAKERIVRLGANDRTLVMWRRSRVLRRLKPDRGISPLELGEHCVVAVAASAATADIALAAASPDRCFSADDSSDEPPSNPKKARPRGPSDSSSPAQHAAGGAGGAGGADEAAVDAELNGGSASPLLGRASPDGAAEEVVVVSVGDYRLVIGPLCDLASTGLEARDLASFFRDAIGAVAPLYIATFAVNEALETWAAYRRQSSVLSAGFSATTPAASVELRVQYQRAVAEDARAVVLLRDAAMRLHREERVMRVRSSEATSASDHVVARNWQIRASRVAGLFARAKALHATLLDARPRGTALATVTLLAPGHAAAHHMFGGTTALCDEGKLDTDDACAPSPRTDASEHETCIICCERAMEALLVPCGHCCTCLPCSDGLMAIEAGFGGRCPLCREIIDSVQSASAAAAEAAAVETAAAAARAC